MFRPQTILLKLLKKGKGETRGKKTRGNDFIRMIFFPNQMDLEDHKSR